MRTSRLRLTCLLQEANAARHLIRLVPMVMLFRDFPPRRTLYVHFQTVPRRSSAASGRTGAEPRETVGVCAKKQVGSRERRPLKYALGLMLRIKVYFDGVRDHDGAALVPNAPPGASRLLSGSPQTLAHGAEWRRGAAAA